MQDSDSGEGSGDGMIDATRRSALAGIGGLGVALIGGSGGAVAQAGDGDDVERVMVPVFSSNRGYVTAELDVNSSLVEVSGAVVPFDQIPVDYPLYLSASGAMWLEIREKGYSDVSGGRIRFADLRSEEFIDDGEVQVEFSKDADSIHNVVTVSDGNSFMYDVEPGRSGGEEFLRLALGVHTGLIPYDGDSLTAIGTVGDLTPPSAGSLNFRPSEVIRVWAAVPETEYPLSVR